MATKTERIEITVLECKPLRDIPYDDGYGHTHWSTLWRIRGTDGYLYRWLTQTPVAVGMIIRATPVDDWCGETEIKRGRVLGWANQ